MESKSRIKFKNKKKKPTKNSRKILRYFFSSVLKTEEISTFYDKTNKNGLMKN